MPLVALSWRVAASSELSATVPMKAPMPENGAMTPTLTVSLPPFPPPPEAPLAQAARPAPPSADAATTPIPARPAKPRNRRRVSSSSAVTGVRSGQAERGLLGLELGVLRSKELDDRVVGYGARGSGLGHQEVHAVGVEGGGDHRL